LLLLLDNFLGRTDVLDTLDLDGKDAIEILAEDPTVEFKNVLT
jgi:hypothetical protein